MVKGVEKPVDHWLEFKRDTAVMRQHRAPGNGCPEEGVHGKQRPTGITRPEDRAKQRQAGISRPEDQAKQEPARITPPEDRL